MHRRNAQLAIAAGLIAMISLASMGCGGGSKNFTPEEFKKVQKGMTEDKVKEILGNPAESLEALGIKRSFWHVGDKYYSVSFADGKVQEPLGPTSKEENDAMKALMELGKKLKG